MWNSEHYFEKIENSTGKDYMLRAKEGVPHNGVYIRSHMHLEHEIFWFRNAAGEFSIGRERFPIVNNTLVYVSPLMPHDMKLEFSKIHEQYLFQYNNSFINRLKYPLPTFQNQVGIVTQLDTTDADKLHFLFEWFAKQHQTPHDNAEIAPLLILLLHTVYTHAVFAEKTVYHNESISTFESIINFILLLENVDSYNISLAEAAKQCELSPTHFSRTFRKIMQMTFKEYLVSKKIALSAHLLVNTNLSITNVAYQCEFTDSAYYCFIFKKLMGMTPKGFRIKSRSTKQLSTKHDD